VAWARQPLFITWPGCLPNWGCQWWWLI
jgi:hypothetical protein